MNSKAVTNLIKAPATVRYVKVKKAPATIRYVKVMKCIDISEHAPLVGYLSVEVKGQPIKWHAGL